MEGFPIEGDTYTEYESLGGNRDNSKSRFWLKTNSGLKDALKKGPVSSAPTVKKLFNPRPCHKAPSFCPAGILELKVVSSRGNCTYW